MQSLSFWYNPFPIVCKPQDAFQLWNIAFSFHRNVQTKANLKEKLTVFFLILFAMLILVFTRQILQKYCKICNFAATHLYLVCKPDDAFQIWNITFPFHRNVQTKAKLKEKLTVFFLILFAMSFDPVIQLYFIYDYFLWFVLEAIFRSSHRPNLYIPSTISIWKRCSSKAIWADKKWACFWQISWNIKQNRNLDFNPEFSS